MNVSGKPKRVPLYTKVFEALRREIVERDLPANTQLLTEDEAIARFRVSRITVRQAFERLEREGHIYRVQGKGAFTAPSETKPAKTVGFLATCILSSGVESVILRAIEEYLYANGINLIVCNTDNNFEKATSYVKRLIRSKIDAIIYVPILTEEAHDQNVAILDYLWNNNIPVVLVDRYIKEIEARSHIVTPNNAEAAFSAAEHLIALGHKRIGTLRVSHSTSTDERLAGIARAVAEHGLPDNPGYHEEIIREEDYRAAAIRFRTMQEPPTAIMALNDSLAYGIIDALFEIGMRVPEDMAVVGFDDYSNSAPKRAVSLSTVRVPLWEEGRLAASIVVDLLKGRPLKPVHSEVQCELIVRETCGARSMGVRSARTTPQTKGGVAVQRAPGYVR